MQVYRVRIPEENGWFISACDDEIIVVRDDTPVQITHNVLDSIPSKYKGNYFDILESNIVKSEIGDRLKHWSGLLKMAGGYKVYV